MKEYLARKLKDMREAHLPRAAPDIQSQLIRQSASEADWSRQLKLPEAPNQDQSFCLAAVHNLFTPTDEPERFWVRRWKEPLKALLAGTLGGFALGTALMECGLFHPAVRFVDALASQAVIMGFTMYTAALSGVVAWGRHFDGHFERRYSRQIKLAKKTQDPQKAFLRIARVKRALLSDITGALSGNKRKNIRLQLQRAVRDFDSATRDVIESVVKGMPVARGPESEIPKLPAIRTSNAGNNASKEEVRSALARLCQIERLLLLSICERPKREISAEGSLEPILSEALNSLESCSFSLGSRVAQICHPGLSLFKFVLKGMAIGCGTATASAALFRIFS